MLSRRVTTARHLPQALGAHAHAHAHAHLHTHPRPRPIPSPRLPFPQTQTRHLSQSDIEDPGQNGGYLNPPREKRQFRDPYADWWDKQERRNYGEPLHEDNDLLSIMSPEEYTHTSPARGFFQLGCFVAAVGALAVVVRLFYEDKPSAPRVFPGGLEEELGGPRAVRARKPGEGQW
ncbi:MAG: hypothetical protein M1816_006842 [Peltula sp. TS41687]|nr:MAG: hypothetical protein M1816_006842 [Peltula sp. TS41687]